MSLFDKLIVFILAAGLFVAVSKLDDSLKDIRFELREIKRTYQSHLGNSR